MCFRAKANTISWILYALFVLSFPQCKEMVDTKIIQKTPLLFVAINPGARWAVHQTEGNVRLNFGSSNIYALIDFTDEKEDGRYAGIFLKSNTVNLSGFYASARTAFFIPDQAITQDTVWLKVFGSNCNVIMHQGNYAQIKPSGNPSIDRMPIEMIANIQTDGHTINVSLSGMYYFMLPKDNTILAIFSKNKTKIDLLSIALNTGKMIQYFDNVDSLFIQTKKYGSFKVATNAKRLQLDIPSASAPDDILFELDFDHSYKDSNQVSVSSTINFEIP